MIIYKPGQDIFTSTAHFLVNPVNTKGISGKGLALEFKNRFSKNNEQYKAYCNESPRKGGDLFWYEPEVEDILNGDKAIINLFTKEDWKKPSQIEWIERGLMNILEEIDTYFLDGKYPVPLIALPMIGCGEGKLNEEEVLAVITKTFSGVKFDVEVYTRNLSNTTEPVEEPTEPK